MTATVETSIWLAIKARINSLSLSFPIAWPGEIYDPSLSPYIRVGRVSSAPVPAFIADGKPHTRTGFIILTLAHPLGPDPSVFDQYAGTIADHFRDGTMMKYGNVCIRVTEYPHIVEGYEDNGFWSIPIRIPWRTFV